MSGTVLGTGTTADYKTDMALLLRSSETNGGDGEIPRQLQCLEISTSLGQVHSTMGAALGDGLGK